MSQAIKNTDSTKLRRTKYRSLKAASFFLINTFYIRQRKSQYNNSFITISFDKIIRPILRLYTLSRERRGIWSICIFIRNRSFTTNFRFLRIENCLMRGLMSATKKNAFENFLEHSSKLKYFFNYCISDYAASQHMFAYALFFCYCFTLNQQ